MNGINYNSPEALRPLTAYIMNTLRILKGKNPGDNYYDEYLKHYAREGDKFYDQYHFAIQWVLNNHPKRILEIGVRTGLSICNMLSAYIDYSSIESIRLVDIWSDGYASPEIVKMNMRAMNFPKRVMDLTEFIVGSSLEEIPKYDSAVNYYDYILVDGDHAKKAAAQDLKNVVRLCAPGGVIVFDDISEHGCNLLDVWEAFKTAHYHLFDFDMNLNGKGTAWAVKK